MRHAVSQSSSDRCRSRSRSRSCSNAKRKRIYSSLLLVHEKKEMHGAASAGRHTCTWYIREYIRYGVPGNKLATGCLLYVHAWYQRSMAHKRKQNRGEPTVPFCNFGALRLDILFSYTNTRYQVHIIPGTWYLACILYVGSTAVCVQL